MSLTDFICCIACVTSCSVGIPIALVMVTDSLFRTEKCSAHFFCCQRITFIVVANSYTCLCVSTEFFDLLLCTRTRYHHLLYTSTFHVVFAAPYLCTKSVVPF